MADTLNNSPLKAFSEKQHRNDTWETKISSSRNLFIRALWNFSSLKRHGIDVLASYCPQTPVVADLGCGNGAYALWFLGKRPSATMIAVDWSFQALRKITHSQLLRVCADIHCLPFKPEMIDALFSIDTLGHVSNIDSVLDEILRVCKKGSPLFLHAECRDYQYHWPDRLLIRKNQKDIIAEMDGHFFLKTSAAIYHSLYSRFFIRLFYSPAGYAGWLIGYPEKYHHAFKQANLRFLSLLTTIFAFIKKNIISGPFLRIANAVTNKLELFLGLGGGGSCFAHVRKPMEEN